MNQMTSLIRSRIDDSRVIGVDFVIDFVSISNEYLFTIYLSDTCNARPFLLFNFFFQK